MKKIVVLAIALLIAVPMAANAVQIQCTTVSPIVAGIAQSLCIDPGYAPVFDQLTGQPVIDPCTGLQLQKRTWVNYMFWAKPANGGYVTHLQSVSIQKCIPERKVSCLATADSCWPTAAHVVTQQGIDCVNLCWPLAYEVDGVEIKLTVTYTTDVSLAYPSPLPPCKSRIHVEVYSWIVSSNSFAAFAERLGFFEKLPAGTCETFAVTPLSGVKILQFINGYGAPQFGTFCPGIAYYLSINNKIAAAQKFAELEAYIDCVCKCHCDALYTSGINAGTPDPKGEQVLDNCTVPAASLLLNDLWAVGKALNVLIDVK